MKSRIPTPEHLDSDLAQVYRHRVRVLERAAAFMAEGEPWCFGAGGVKSLLLDVDRLQVFLRPSGEVVIPLRLPDGQGVLVLLPPDDVSQVILDAPFSSEMQVSLPPRALWLEETLQMICGLAPGRCAAAVEAVTKATLMGEALKTVRHQAALREALTSFRGLLDGQEAAMQVVDEVFGGGAGQPYGSLQESHVLHLRDLVRASTPPVADEVPIFAPLRAASPDRPVSRAARNYLSDLRYRAFTRQRRSSVS